jgi:sulfate adenylyltransferase large subunit
MGAQARPADFQAQARELDMGAEAAPAAQRGLLRFIACGSVDDGKSTLIGRLLYDSDTVPEDQLAALATDSRTFGARRGDLDFSLLVDALAAEREQGITIDVAYRYFSTPRRSFIVADTPGHEQYTRNMATGASTAGLAIILVDARKGVLPQTHRHSFILSMLGVRHVVLAVNKMDLVGYSQSTFSAIDVEYRRFAAPLAFASVVSIPISALLGDNLRRRSARMSWYRGPTLLDYLDTVETDGSSPKQAFRMPVQLVNRPSPDFRGFSGLIVGGAVRPGNKVCVLPSGQTARVTRIVTYDGDLDRATAGQCVTLVLDRELDVSRGDVIAADRFPPPAARTWSARLLWTADEPFDRNRPLLVKAGAATVPAQLGAKFEILDILSGYSRLSGELRVNDIARCLVVTEVPIVVEPYAQSRELGGFILIDRLSGNTVALGTVDAVEPAEGVSGAHKRRRRWFETSSERPWRSIAKAVTWRATGGLDTFVLAYLFTSNLKISAALSLTEVFTKIVLYYGHERVWARIPAGVKVLRRPVGRRRLRPGGPTRG